MHSTDNTPIAKDRTYANTGTYAALLQTAVYIVFIYMHGQHIRRPGFLYSPLPVNTRPSSVAYIHLEPVCVYTYIIYIECTTLGLIESHTTQH